MLQGLRFRKIEDFSLFVLLFALCVLVFDSHVCMCRRRLAFSGQAQCHRRLDLKGTLYVLRVCIRL